MIWPKLHTSSQSCIFNPWMFSVQASRPLAAPKTPPPHPAPDEDSSPETEVWASAVPLATHASFPHIPAAVLLLLLLPWQLCALWRHPSGEGAPHIPEFPHHPRQHFPSFSLDSKSCKHVVDVEGCTCCKLAWTFVIIMEQWLLFPWWRLDEYDWSRWEPE